jgi:hypothetical protein
MIKRSRPLKLLLALILAVPISAAGQADKAAVEYRSLLDIAFAERDGSLLVDRLHIVFPPSGYEQAMLTVSKASGEEVAKLPLRLESYLSFPVFGNFVPDSRPAEIKLGQPGDFIMTITVANEVLTRFPFALVAEPNADPYESPKQFWRDGPWRDLGYFSLPADPSGPTVGFNWWMSLRELPIGMNNPSVTVRLFDGYKQIAASRTNLRLDTTDWQFFGADLIKTKTPGAQRLTLRELVDHDTTYLLIVTANGKPIKSFRLEVKNGRLLWAQQSRIDFEPHADFICPRFVESKLSSNSRHSITDAYWVQRNGARSPLSPLSQPRNRTDRIGRK